ncbi:unnamed protein product [Peniophora sp. CBMAI 1063]|nr:unnamed protein product [Peniophora sp. CBMAI 1063]
MASSGVGMDVDVEDVWAPLVDARFNVDSIRATDSNVALKSSLQSLDTELATMQRALSTANQRRNKLTGACKIPAEILSEIFSLSQVGWAPFVRTKGQNSAIFNYGWIRITHVCSYWREVAIQTPSLWTANIDVYGVPIDFIPLVIQRSRDLPLEVTLGHNREDYEPAELERVVTTWFTADTAAVNGRIRTLSIQCLEEDLGTIATYLQAPMPKLVELVVDIENPDEPIVHRLPRTFCPEAQLIKLRLVDCLPHWDSPLFSATLTHLTLTCFGHPDTTFFPTHERLVGLLSSLGNLEYLDLYDVFPPPSSTNTTIRLPASVKHVYLEARRAFANCLSFVSTLSLPPSTCVEAKVLEIGSAIEHQEDPFALVETLTPMLNPTILALQNARADQAKPVELVVELYGIGFHAVQQTRAGWTTAIPAHANTLPRERADGSVFFSVLPDSEVDPAGEFCLCTRVLSLPLREIRAISFARHAITQMKRANVLRDLVRAQAVRRLGIVLSDSAPLLDVLSERLPDGSFRVFPLLEILHVHVGYLSSDVTLRESDCVQDTLALAAFVAARREYGAPLKEIVVEKALADWDVWEAVKYDVPVTPFDFPGK